jgi:hypothetical protein
MVVAPIASTRIPYDPLRDFDAIYRFSNYRQRIRGSSTAVSVMVVVSFLSGCGATMTARKVAIGMARDSARNELQSGHIART